MAVPSHPKLAGFDIVQATYKKIKDHGIRADVLVPRKLATGKRPVIVHIHGGGLVMGDSLYMGFWPYWLSDLGLQHDAVIISPNYRLMPEATSPQICEDMEDFWKWLHSPMVKGLLAAHPTPTELDLTRILVAGGSAGGLLGAVLAFSHPDEIRAAALMYPAVDIGSADFSTPRTAPPFGNSLSKSVFDDFNAAVIPGTITSSDSSESRLQYMLAAVEHGGLGGLYARSTEHCPQREILYPMECVENPNFRLPRGGITIMHGRQDSIVPLAGVEHFVLQASKVTNRAVRGEVTLTVREGEHGFDVEERFAEPWLQQMLQSAIDAWLE